jgi:hypothetical protein
MGSTSHNQHLWLKVLFTHIFPTYICHFKYYLDMIWTQPLAGDHQCRHFYIVLCKLFILQDLQILHCDNLVKSWGIPYNKCGCTISYLIFKSFRNVGLMIHLFGLKHVIILDYNLVVFDGTVTDCFLSVSLFVLPFGLLSCFWTFESSGMLHCVVRWVVK